jgi:hypothetical protein
MKPIYVITLFILFFISSACLPARSAGGPSGTACYAQTKNGTSFYSAGHDSLLFDGRDMNHVINDIAPCVMIVDKVSGDMQATVLERKRYDSYVCSKTDTATYAVVVKRKVKPGDQLVLGDVITTGPYSNIEGILQDGSDIMFGSNSKVMIGADYCVTPGGIELLWGKIWLKVKKQLGSAKYEVKTERAVHGVRGTVFTIETKIEGSDTLDITKVYEGSVEVSAVNYDKSDLDKSGEELKKINDDYQSGKITAQEMAEKMKPYTENVGKELSEMKLTETVEAGFKCVVGKKGPANPNQSKAMMTAGFDITF